MELGRRERRADAERVLALPNLTEGSRYHRQRAIRSAMRAAAPLPAEHDGVANPADVRAGMAQLAASSRLEVIGGAVHASSDVTAPSRDGVPTLNRAQAEQAILERVRAYLQQVT